MARAMGRRSLLFRGWERGEVWVRYFLKLCKWCKQ